MKFMRVETPGIGAPIVRYKEQGQTGNLEISASCVGISFSGNSCILAEAAELEEFAQTVSSAWNDYKKAKAKQAHYE